MKIYKNIKQYLKYFRVYGFNSPGELRELREERLYESVT